MSGLRLIYATAVIICGFYFVLVSREIWRTAEYTNELYTAISSAALGVAILIFGFKLATMWWDRHRPKKVP